MQLTSNVFQDNTALPVDYTCKGRGVSPPLTIKDVPDDTESLALIAHDPDAVHGQDFLHWSVWNITPDTSAIDEGHLPAGAVQGTNDYPCQTYGPACPPAGTGLHRYIFDLYALDIVLDLPAGASRVELESAIAGHSIASARLVGIIQS